MHLSQPVEQWPSNTEESNHNIQFSQLQCILLESEFSPADSGKIFKKKIISVLNLVFKNNSALARSMLF